MVLCTDIVRSVLVCNTRDPSSVVDFSDLLYDNEDLAEAFSNALGDSGVFVVQIGEGNAANDPPEDFGNDSTLIAFRQHLTENGFQSIVEYAEPHCGFGHPWSFFAAFKNNENKARFFNDQAMVDLEIQRRLLPSKSGAVPLRYFDGATMATYQNPSRLVENAWCGTEDADCGDGHGFDPYVGNLSTESKSVNESGLDVGFIGLDEAVQSAVVLPMSYKLVKTSNIPMLHNVSNALDSELGCVDDSLVRRGTKYSRIVAHLRQCHVLYF